MSNENKQPDERAESDMRAAFAQHMGQPWEAALETALEAARRIWSLAWGASRFYERQAQPDERATFTDLAHEVWSAAQLPPGEGIADGVARIEAILARATQQATKGDERAALDVEILSGPCVNVCVTQDSKPKDQRFDVVVIRKTDFDKLMSTRATTPSPVDPEKS